MRLSQKLILAMGLLTLAIFVLSVFSLYQMNTINAASTELSQKWMPSIVLIEEANSYLSNYRIAEFGLLLAPAEHQEHYRKRLADSNAAITKNLDLFAKQYIDSTSRGLFDRFLELSRESDSLHTEMMNLLQEGKQEDAVGILFARSREIYVAATDILVQLVAVQVKGGEKARLRGDELYSGAFTMTGILLCFSTIVGIALTVVIVRGTLKQLGKDPGILMHLAQRVTRGDYNIDDGSQKIGVYGNLVQMVDALKQNISRAEDQSRVAADESANAKKAMAQAESASEDARSKTQVMLRAAEKLEEVAQIVSSASAELSAQLEQAERGAAEQASRVTETATAMEEMNGTVLEVARNASSASEVSTQTRVKAEEGSRVVSRAVSSIQQVQQESLALKEDMVRLGGQAQAISQIMSVISDIADQTNLLALNAAIEAARAGDAGRGFAVVADEVRKLAEKTMASTTDVGNAIRSIQASATKSMSQVDRAVTSIEEATGYAIDSGSALQEIVKMADSTADQVRAIATASEEQSSTSEEINRSISEVNAIASETARAMQESAAAVSDLAHQAQTLTGLIVQMKR